MKVNAQKVGCWIRETIPHADENIVDDLGLDMPKLKEICTNISVYQRDKYECPFAIGNWIVDFNNGDNILFCIKLPFDMTKEQLDIYLKPVLNIFSYGTVQDSSGIHVIQ